MKDAHPSVCILLLNWNGWQDTIECLESVFRTTYSNYCVVVCDNGSTDDSMRRLKQWAEGTLCAWTSPAHPLHSHSFPPIAKPLSYREYSRSEAESGGAHSDADAQLVFIQTGANLGFAGGNNVGLRYALARNEIEYVWLLNNDTVVAPDALSHLVEKVTADSTIGMCGSTLLFYHRPDVVQALGGATYNPWIGTAKHIGEQTVFSPPCAAVPHLDYVVGASMLVSKPFLRRVGLMNEAYFLYFEEIDWASRAKGIFKLGYAPESVVYHKQGATTGSRSRTQVNLQSMYYDLRSRLRFTRTFMPQYLASVYICIVGFWLKSLLRGDVERAEIIFKILRGK